MPNWAYGQVEVTGKKEAIAKFANRFIYKDEFGEDSKRDFFYRSFIHEKKDDVMAEIEWVGDGEPGDITFTLCVNFAWSANSCLISKSLDEYNNCVYLVDACKNDKVSVSITTEEEGMSFEEFITCDSNGNLEDECRDMQRIECKNCGATRPLPSYVDIGDAECYDCEGTDFEEID